MNAVVEVLVVIPVRAYREAVVRALADQPGLRPVGSGGSASEALAGVRRLRPTVVLLDLTTAGSIAAIGAIRDDVPDTQLIALAVDETRDDVITAAEAGVVGFIGQEVPLRELAAAVVATLRGEASCSPRIASLLLARLRRAQSDVRQVAPAMPPSLTAREREILLLMAEGRTNGEIAKQLFIGLSTVKSHVHAVLRKLGVSRREAAAALVVRAATRGSAPGTLASRELTPGDAGGVPDARKADGRRTIPAPSRSRARVVAPGKPGGG